jgi:hypothetical protein
MVRQAGSESKTGKGQNKEDEKKQRLGQTGARRNTLVDLANKTNWHRRTENTGINTQGIMGKMGDTWRGVETRTRTGETDQGVTIYSAFGKYSGALTFFHILFTLQPYSKMDQMLFFLVNLHTIPHKDKTKTSF